MTPAADYSPPAVDDRSPFQAVLKVIGDQIRIAPAGKMKRALLLLADDVLRREREARR